MNDWISWKLLRNVQVIIYPEKYPPPLQKTNLEMSKTTIFALCFHFNVIFS